jgi:hypothetical protein
MQEISATADSWLRKRRGDYSPWLNWCNANCEIVVNSMTKCGRVPEINFCRAKFPWQSTSPQENSRYIPSYFTRISFPLSAEIANTRFFPSRKIDYVIALMTLHRFRFPDEIFTLIAGKKYFLPLQFTSFVNTHYEIKTEFFHNTKALHCLLMRY